jgi:hypothetical protein
MVFDRADFQVDVSATKRVNDRLVVGDRLVDVGRPTSTTCFATPCGQTSEYGMRHNGEDMSALAERIAGHVRFL